ncbi:MAG: sulfite exporter TauE/SafE family protein [Brevinematales bacterium]|nr:sulfite exporter TauE/SafE family protein [Brevinematales bacterium]
MDILKMLLLLVFSGFTGVFSGLVGIGGATFLIPFLVYVFGFDQKLAQGTTLLAFTLPSFLFGAITYYKNGNVKIEYSVVMFVGMLFGALIGASVAQKVDSRILSRIFGLILGVLGIKIFIDSFR